MFLDPFFPPAPTSSAILKDNTQRDYAAQQCLLRLLPCLELVLSVISVAADHQQATARALSLVSSWVHRHVEPALYGTVRLRSARSLASFISTLDGKPDGFARRIIKKLCITALGPISSIHTVLSKCTSLASSFSVPLYVHCVRGQPSSTWEEQGDVLDGPGGRPDLIVSASKAPRSFLSEWEESDAFWQRAEDSIGAVVA